MLLQSGIIKIINFLIHFFNSPIFTNSVNASLSQSQKQCKNRSLLASGEFGCLVSRAEPLRRFAGDREWSFICIHSLEITLWSFNSSKVNNVADHPFKVSLVRIEIVDINPCKSLSASLLSLFWMRNLLFSYSFSNLQSSTYFKLK